MAKPLTTTISPSAEKDFLKALKPFVDRLANTAKGDHKVAAVVYQRQFDERIDALQKRRPPGAGRKRNPKG